MDKIHLLSHDRWYEMANYDPATRAIIDVYRPETGISEIPRSGNFGTLGRERLIVRATGIDEIKVGFEQDSEFDLREAYIEWERSDSGHTFFRLFHYNYQHQVIYEVPVTQDDWETYGELEDFDFGLWVLNVKNSFERQRILLDRWTESLNGR
jgi:hypothetical protein